MKQIYSNCKIKKIPHNYFPAPKTPFVLNLASSNDRIREYSINHCIQGLQLAKRSNSPFYSAHFGFCIDPNPNELGNQLIYQNNFDKNKNLNYFYQSIVTILKEAEKLGILFLIENNVIAKSNLKNGVNPLLGCSSKEIIEIINTIKSNYLGLLLDTAHLKVSCNSLNLSIENELANITPFIKAVHHSDNDGLVDNNSSLSNDYWFLKFINKFSKIPHIIEVCDLSANEIIDQIKLLNKKWK
jgi:sugar phosphate isomerase/epimerase